MTSVGSDLGIVNETEEHIREFEEPSTNLTDSSEKVIGYILDASSIFLLVVIMMSLGCTLKLSELKKYSLNPKELGIAVMAQYGIMPLSAFSLGYIFNLSSIESLAILICGCCPGGSISNILTFAVNGDMNLSILMTICSTVLALGMMPLLLYIYCLGLDLGPLYKNVPFLKIMLSLAITIIPCFLGALISSKKPQYCQSFIKVGKILGILLAVEIIVLCILYLKSNIFKIFTPGMIGASLLLPFLGYVLGYAMAAILQLHEQVRRTICMETGCQNVQLCTAILKVTFDAEVIGAYFMFPLLYILSQVLQGLIFVAIFRLHDKENAKALAKSHRSVNEDNIEENLSSTDASALLI